MRVIVPLLALFWPAAAMAQNVTPQMPRCGEHAMMVERLAKQYGEHPIFIGLLPNRLQVVELFAAEGGTWTILNTDVQGRSCVVRSGVDGAYMDPVTGGDT